MPADLWCPIRRQTEEQIQPNLIPGSSALLQTLECSEHHPSERSPVVSDLWLTRLQLFGTNSLFLSAILPVSVLFIFPSKPFFFKYLQMSDSFCRKHSLDFNFSLCLSNRILTIVSVVNNNWILTLVYVLLSNWILTTVSVVNNKQN